MQKDGHSLDPHLDQIERQTRKHLQIDMGRQGIVSPQS